MESADFRIFEMSSFSELISSKRKQLGLSQRELAASVKKEDGTPISPQYLNDLELQRRDAPSDHLILELARVLEIPADHLFYAAGEVSPDLRNLNPSTPAVRKAIAAFRKTLQDA